MTRADELREQSLLRQVEKAARVLLAGNEHLAALSLRALLADLDRVRR